MPQASNPLLVPSKLDFGLVDFAALQLADYTDAMRQAMAVQLEVVDAIANNPSAPTFDNTIIALELSGINLERATAAFYTISASAGSDETRAIEAEFAPLLASHEDSIKLNRPLFTRIRSLHDVIETLRLDTEDEYLLRRYFIEFQTSGAGLNEDDQATLRQLNEQLAGLETTFDGNLIKDSARLAVTVAYPEMLSGLSNTERSTLEVVSDDDAAPPSWRIELVLPTGHPLLSKLGNRELRERLMAASLSRASAGEYDNTQIVTAIVRLRAQRAKLLGFENHAELVLADQTIGSLAKAKKLLSGLARSAVANARQERAQLEAIAGAPLTAADWPYWSQQARKQLATPNTDELSVYFEAERVLQDGVFFAANRLYGITFAERADLNGYLPDVRVFEAANDDGSPLGLYLLDLYTREGKHGGAWMNQLAAHNKLTGEYSIVTNNLNVVQPPSGSPTLLSFDEVETLFHEFGHALHALFSGVRYPKFAGTNVFRDYVEFPSQVNEMWMLWPEVLENYAVHYETGQRLDPTVGERLRASASYGQGFATCEYLAAAWLDLAWHKLTQGEHVESVEAFEHSALAHLDLADPALPPRYRSNYFAHVFSGGYDAGYYSYIWSEVLDADSVAWFKEQGGLNRANGERFRTLLALGGSRDPLQAYREFRGRDADITHLLERRQLG